MKKLLTLFMAGLMTVSLAGCGGSEMSDKELIVGTQAMNGYFMPSEGLGNNSYDKDIRDLIHGYSPIAFTAEGEFEIDKTVVKSHKVEADKAGNAVYTFTLNDIKWNDGTPVTADDYVLSALVAASPELIKAKASDVTGEGLVGYKAYHTGKVDQNKYFEGVKKIDDKTFSLTIAKDKLPYFWEMSYVRIQPFSMKALTIEGDKIISDEKGSRFSGNMSEVVGKFVDSYRKNPSISAGPYKFESFQNKQVKLVANENYAGDYNGQKPKIKTIIVKEINAKLDMDTLVNNEIDILAGVVEGDKIKKAKANKETIQESTYPRNGYGNVPMHSDFGATKEKEVRHAIAYVLDKDELVKNILGGYGSTLNGNYSTASWEYAAKKADIESSLINYAYSIDKANAELDKSTYKFEKDGKTAWDAKKAGANYLRYNEKGEKLVINHLGTEDNVVTDTIELQFKQNCPKVGIEFTITRTDFAGLMDGYYYAGAKPDNQRKYNTFNMATNFADARDPYLESYACEYSKTPTNPTNTCNKKMDATMKKLRAVKSDDKKEFANVWLEFQKEWNDELPMVPIYANQYYDFADKELEGFKTTPFRTWSQSICELSWK